MSHILSKLPFSVDSALTGPVVVVTESLTQTITIFDRSVGLHQTVTGLTAEVLRGEVLPPVGSRYKRVSEWSSEFVLYEGGAAPVS